MILQEWVNNVLLMLMSIHFPKDRIKDIQDKVQEVEPKISYNEESIKYYKKRRNEGDKRIT
jgi:hypothetical protein